MLSFLGTIGRMLPGYIQGERQANQDNWSDLSNYNQVQTGQIQNAMDEALFNPRLQMFDQALQNSEMGVVNNAMNTWLNMNTLNDQLFNRQVQYRLGAPLQFMQLGALGQMINQSRNNPYSGFMMGGNPIMGMYDPSILSGGLYGTGF